MSSRERRDREGALAISVSVSVSVTDTAKHYFGQHYNSSIDGNSKETTQHTFTQSPIFSLLEDGSSKGLADEKKARQVAEPRDRMCI